MFITGAILLGLASMIAYGISNVASQSLSKKYGPAQTIFYRGIIVTLILAIASVPSYSHINHHLGSVFDAILLGIGGYIPVLAFNHALRVNRVGVIAPIAGCSPLVAVLLAASVLHSQVHLVQWLAILMIIAANVAISVNLRDWRNSHLLNLSSGIPFSLVAAVGWGLFYFIIIYPTHAIGPWLAALFAEFGVTLAAGIHVFKSKNFDISYIKSPAIFINAILLVIGTVTYTVGVHSYSQVIVITLSNSTAVISILLGVAFLRDKLKSFELLAGGAMIVGVILLSIS